MMKKFDLVVIGTGAAGAGVASRCRGAGWSVAIIDSLPYGGTCALRGCDPKKVLVGATEALDWVRRMKGKGIAAGAAKIEWADLMRFKRSFTDPVPAGNEKWFADAGIDMFHGPARFTGPTSVQVGDDVLQGKYVHIAAGARPADLGFNGQEHVISSTQFLELDQLPSRVVFIGGGYISFEFAHVAARAGARVTILHRSARLLHGFDPDLVAMLVKHTRALGVDVQLEAEVCGVSKAGNGFSVQADTPGGKHSFVADLVVHGAGRAPAIDDLGLEDVNIEYDRRGVAVNAFMQSVSNPSVYAAGDCAATAGPPLTPVGAYEGRIVAANLLEGNHTEVVYPVIPTIPSAVFTVPPLATVGLQEAQAREQGLEFDSHFDTTTSWYSARRTAEPCAAYKALVEKGSGRILGAHVLGTNAEELINLFTMAMRGQLNASAIKEIIFAYPTYASDIGYMV
ncbi:MAG: NAD(P)/FAD-dependent oxidoreductase [Gammaproteobacteria bacterium]|nr:MAG: NAD(P)/FAD-dependent oxidoreductase [Gammaproteobacteria bacterium]